MTLYALFEYVVLVLVLISALLFVSRGFLRKLWRAHQAKRPATKTGCAGECGACKGCATPMPSKPLVHVIKQS